ncbi:lipopolysaccharide biosynthesis protein [Thioalkalivibrio sp. AKL12]|uniref:lipopolysaccharide biosynthesis protein n=1 Tax=Thioalkalivibrio sp. AKL12 TaxID=1158159 RepID=UPI0003617410|nr:oligosaccharide flippase family protein [Thioalkalivibrio sp. AKL12]
MTLRQQLMRGGVGSIAIKVLATGIAFGLAVVLARVLGPEGYGVYAFALSLIMLLAIPAQVGLPALVVRETAKAQAKDSWGLIRGLWRWSNLFIVVFAVLMVTVGALALWLGRDWLGEPRWQTLAVGLALVPLIALANVRGAALRGLRRVVLGQLPESILRPGLLLVTVLAAVWWSNGGALTPVGVMGLHGLAAFAAFIIGAAVLLRARPPGLRTAPPPEYQARYWRRAALPLAMLAGLQLIIAHTDIIMLGIIRSDEEVGVYRVVVQVATLVVFGLQAINQVLQPYFARLHAQGELVRLQQLVTYSARIILLLALPPVLLMAAFGGPLLDLLFGAEYRLGALALAILALGQLVNAAMGSVGLLLNMTDHERDTVKGVAIAALCNVALNVGLIPPFGLEGAAAATAITIVIWNLLLWTYVWRRLGIESSAITWRRR